MTNIRLLKNKRVADTWRHLDSLGYEVCPLTGAVRDGSHSKKQPQNSSITIRPLASTLELMETDDPHAS